MKTSRWWTAACHGNGQARSRVRRSGVFVLAWVLVLLLLVGAASALGDGQGGDSAAGLPTTDDMIKAIEGASASPARPTATDPTAAEDEPPRDLGRAEAVELLSGVFGTELEATAGPYDDLEVERFLAPNVAVVPGPQGDGDREPSAPTEGARVSANEIPEEVSGATLLTSTMPLAVEGPSGGSEPVDLSLEHTEGELQPAAPLVEVGVPEELGEGVQLPGSGVRIELAGAPEARTPSTVDKSVAVYPNVAEDTDLAVAPTPTGVETLTQIRSAEAPRVETFHLRLPPGASLEATSEGGAAVTRGGETLVAVAPPTALDAAGEAVPVDLSVSGASLTLTVSLTGSTAYPIILDPLFQVYEWSRMTSWPATGEDGICNDSFEMHGENICGSREEWGEEHVDGSPQHISLGGEIEPSPGLRSAGLFISSHGTAEAGNRGTFLYAVPRYFTELEHERAMPTSFIAHLTLSDLTWKAYSEHMSPYLFAGIWDPVAQNWVNQYYAHEGLAGHGLNNTTYPYQFENATNPDTHAKVAEVDVVATETQPNSNAQVEVGDATVQLGDNEAPGPPVPPAPVGWLNQTPTNITVTDEDTGLGMSSITASTEQLGANGLPLHSWKASYGCLGVGDAACPRKWNTSESGHPHLTVEPALLPTGFDYLNLVAEDPVGNRSQAGYAEIKVDHAAPEVALSGTATETESLGAKRPNYLLKVNAADGSSSAPQSGVAKVVIEFDGQVVKKEERACASENCQMAPEWTIESAKYAAGQHTLKVTATDGVGNTTARTLQIELDPSQPTLSLSGTMTEQATLGTTRPRYELALSASSLAGVQRPAVEYVSSLGSQGGGEGQLRFPSDVARDAAGDLWVADWGNDRIKEFGEAGEYLGQFGGGEGSGNGQFRGPTAIAVDARGNLWVADAGNDRIEEFNEKGEYLRQFGSKGTGPGQFAGEGPQGLAVGPGGNVWVSDTYGGRLEEFGEKGEYVRSLGTQGSGPGQLSQPTGIDVAPGGDIYVADWVNDRVEEFHENGEYVRQFGSKGPGNGQFQHPDALAVDARGDVWVGDTWDGRVEEFTGTGEYVARFGSPGSGEGQFGYLHPTGMALDAQGDIWVTDPEGDRVEHWRDTDLAPAFQRAFGGGGSGPGELASPRGLSAPSWGGQFWVADTGHDRIQCFNGKGEFIRETGSPGSGPGQFIEPGAVATDAEGDVWVADTGNDRIQEFNHEGRFIRRIGGLGSGVGQFNDPSGVAVDGEGHVWVTDTDNSRVEEFGHEGEFIRQFGSAGSGAGQLTFPGGIATDAKGDAWVADTSNDRIEEFGPKGEFIRRSGSEGEGEGRFRSPQGIAVGPEGDIWVADTRNDRIEELNPEGGYVAQFGGGGDDEGQFSEPAGIAVDYQGDIWVADTRNDRVQEIGGGEFVRQLGGEGAGAGRLSSPRAVATDGEGDVWVADTENDRVQEFGPAGGFIRQFGSYGTGNGQFRSPSGIAVGSEGDVWVADTGNNRIEKFGPEGRYLSQFGSSGAGPGQFRTPQGIAAGPEGRIWVIEKKGNRVQEFGPGGEFIRQFGSGGSGDGQVSAPTGIAVDAEGDVWVADTGNDRVEEFGPSGAFIRHVGLEGEGEGQFLSPAGIAVGPEGDVWVTDAGNERIEELDPQGGYLAQFGSPGDNEGEFSEPAGVAVDRQGNVWVTDRRDDRVQQIGGGEFLWQFGGEGSGPGSLALPDAVATDAEGHVWVADTGDSRVEEFGPEGGFIRQFGSYGWRDGQFESPEGIAAGPGGDVWVADRYGSRVQEFGPAGEFIRKIGGYGTGNGQFAVPGGLATDSEGDLWAADPYNDRIEEFGAKGEFIRTVGGPGTGNGRFALPQGVATDAKGDVWVADTENDRVEEFGRTGEYLAQLGARGNGPGQLTSPKGIAIGPEGDVWVADTGDSRIEEFSPAGVYLGRLGSQGDEEGRLGSPSGIATDAEGDVWVADTGNDRVEGWGQSAMHSELTTEITVDGKRVDSDRSACVGERCVVNGEWTLESPEYAGAHTVVVTATDGLGNTTRKTLRVQVHPDATRPEVETGGALMKAPEGWVEQEGYGFTATAEDGGYGVTSLALKIDGQTVASSGHACHEGGCEAAIQKTVDMAPYSGGAHEAELVATDGAGNTTTKRWTVNVDPEGRITGTEAEATLEAVDETSGSTIVAPTEEVLEPEQIEGGDDPGLRQNGSEIKSTGVPDETTLSTNLGEGFTMKTPEGTATITPILNEGSSKVSISEGVAGVAADTADEVDSVIRPEYNGAETFQEIRSATSPETYSWRVNLEGGETLRLANGSQAEVLYGIGHLAYLITAESASDATGATVPTSLSVSGNVLTLKLEFRSGSFVYPIVAGQGWEGGYRVPVLIEGPEDETQVMEREQREREAVEDGGVEGPAPSPPSPMTSGDARWIVAANMNSGGYTAPPPEPSCNGGNCATASLVRNFVVDERHVCQIDHCNIWHVNLATGAENERPHFKRGYKYSEWVDGTSLHCHNYYSAVYALGGLGIAEEGCDFAGPWRVFKEEDKHLTVWTRDHITQPFATELVTGVEENFLALQAWVWPNGFQQRVVKHYAPTVIES